MMTTVTLVSSEEKTSYAIANEACSECKFHKSPHKDVKAPVKDKNLTQS